MAENEGKIALLQENNNMERTPEKVENDVEVENQVTEDYKAKDTNYLNLPVTINNRIESLPSTASGSPLIDWSSDAENQLSPEKKKLTSHFVGSYFKLSNTYEDMRRVHTLSPILSSSQADKKSIKDTFRLVPKQQGDPNSYELYHKIVNTKAKQLYETAVEFFNQEQYEKCLSSSRRALFMEPNKLECYLLIGNAYLELCDFKSAILNYKRVCIIDPENEEYFSKLAHIYFLQGQCYFDEGMYLDALECFSRAAEMRPERSGYHARSIACLATLKRHKECLASINKRLQVESNNADLLVLRARLYLLFCNPTLSFFDVKEALALDPNNKIADVMQQSLQEKAEAFKKKALSLELEGKVKEAIMKITRAIDTNPDVIEYQVIRNAIFHRASMHRHNLDFNASIDDLLYAMDKTNQSPNHPAYVQAQQQLLLTFNDFAVDCFNKGFYEEAVVLLEKAIRGEKSNKSLYLNRGDCFYKMGHIHFALLDYQQANELDGNDPNIAIRLSVVYNDFGIREYSARKYYVAEDYFSLAIFYNPPVGQYYLSRARARYMQEKMEEAKVDTISSLNLDPTNKEALSMIARLFSSQTIDEVMESDFAQLVIEALQSVLTEKAQSFGDVENIQGNELNKHPLLPNIELHTKVQMKMKECMKEKEFNINLIKGKKKVNELVESVIQNRQNLANCEPQVGNLQTRNWKSASSSKPRKTLLGLQQLTKSMSSFEV